MHINFHKKQNGIALVTCMIFLMILSVVGVSSMRNSTLEQEMTNNMQDLNHAFQLAESGIARTSNEPTMLDTNSNKASPVEFFYTSYFVDPLVKLETTSYYKGQGIVKGEHLDQINSIDTTSLHIFHITSTGQYNGVISEHAQGITQTGPKTD